MNCEHQQTRRKRKELLTTLQKPATGGSKFYVRSCTCKAEHSLFNAHWNNKGAVLSDVMASVRQVTMAYCYLILHT